MCSFAEDLAEKDAAAEEELGNLDVTILQPPRVKSITFPTYLAPNAKDDMVSCASVDEQVFGAHMTT